jgi:hypothetical protein
MEERTGGDRKGIEGIALFLNLRQHGDHTSCMGIVTFPRRVGGQLGRAIPRAR